VTAQPNAVGVHDQLTVIYASKKLQKLQTNSLAVSRKRANTKLRKAKAKSVTREAKATVVSC